MSVFISLTTCWHYPGKIEQTWDALRSIPSTVPSIFVVNEYPPPENFIDVVRNFVREFPQHRLVQKSHDEKGQARSLNIIMNAVRDSEAKYWMHLEESWYLSPQKQDGFSVDKFIKIMETSPLAQLQLTGHWRDLDTYVDKEEKYVLENNLLVVPAPIVLDELEEKGATMYEQAEKYGKGLGYIWPQFSLLPGITRADTVRSIRFNEDLALWPVKFEFEFAIQWGKIIRNMGLYKATFKEDTFFIRKPGHVSTYDQK